VDRPRDLSSVSSHSPRITCENALACQHLPEIADWLGSFNQDVRTRIPSGSAVYLLELPPRMSKSPKAKNAAHGATAHTCAVLCGTPRTSDLLVALDSLVLARRPAETFGYLCIPLHRQNMRVLEDEAHRVGECGDTQLLQLRICLQRWRRSQATRSTQLGCRARMASIFHRANQRATRRQPRQPQPKAMPP
jgi:hypothetical protein